MAWAANLQIATFLNSARFGGVHNRDDSNFGVYVGVPQFREITISDEKN